MSVKPCAVCGEPSTRECIHDEWIVICGRPLCDEHGCPIHEGSE
jgi:hypothetical protein